MKAIVFEKYGSPDVLQLKEVDKPTPKDNELLIRVYATLVSSGDIIARTFNKISPRKFGMPFLLWLITLIMFGIRKPKTSISILGAEYAGEVEDVGTDVKQFMKGDQIFGYNGPKMGANAEYLCVPEDGVVTIKPTNTTYEEAATIPFGAMTAMHLLNKVNIQSGQKVLINGASGGIGSYAVQFAKNSGAEVTGVCSTPRLELVKSLGADKVIDYTKEDFTQNGEIYDVIFDVLNKSSFSRCKGSLKQNGYYLLANFKMRQVFQMLRTKMVGSKKVICGISMEKPEDLILIKELVEEGKIKSVIDRSFPLEQAAEAHSYYESGNKKGSVIITMEQNNKS